MEFENLQIEIPTEEEKTNSTLFGVKVYEKKYHNDSKSFVIGFNPKSKEFVERKERRAKRFGIKETENSDQDVSGEEISENEVIPTDDAFMKIDLKSLTWPPVPQEASEEIRFDAILVHGVQDMSTKDVFQYFELFGPENLEWIDDFSCNVVWDSDKSVVDAMDNMSKTYTMLSQMQKQNSGIEDHPVESITIKEESDIDDIEEIGGPERVEVKDDLSPKEIWRIGIPFKKNQLFFRYATLKDKKLPGAASRSEYYLKYGKTAISVNEGTGGLISKSRKRKLERMRKVAEDRFKSNEPDVKFVELPKKEEGKMEVDDEEPNVKRVNMDEASANQMTMVADRVEVLQKLGPKYTDDDIRNRLGERHEESDDEDDVDESDSETSYHKNTRTSRGIRDRLGTPNFSSSNGPDVRREIESSKYNKNKNMRSHGYEDDNGVYHDIYQATDLKTETTQHSENHRKDKSKSIQRHEINKNKSNNRHADSPVRDLREKLKKRTNKSSTRTQEDIPIKNEPVGEKLNLCIEIKQEVEDVEMQDQEGEFEF